MRRRSSSSLWLPLLLLALTNFLLEDHGTAAAPQMMPIGPIPMQLHFRPRYPRREPPTVMSVVMNHQPPSPQPSYMTAYNIHKTFAPRDVNDLDARMAKKAMVDVQQTIAEVQRLLARDPSLPRLTRGEIEELFENVTREELAKSIREGDHTRAQHMRALMLVLPYHTNNLSPENLQKIYAQAPQIQLVPNEVAPKKMVGDVLGAHSKTVSTKMAPNPTAVTTVRPTFRVRSTTVPITTIRFTTPKPTTFHPAFPNVIREEGKSSSSLKQVKQVVTAASNIVEVTPEPEKVEVPVAAVVTTEDLKNAEVSDLLASIGLSEGDASAPTFRPLPVEMTTPIQITTPTTTTTEFVVPKEDDPKKMDEDLKMLLRSFGLLKEDDESVGIAPLAPVEFQLPETLSDVAPSHLIQSDGLNVEEPLEPVVPAAPIKADIKADDFVSFKPLPSDSPKLDPGLDELLKSFGILRGGSVEQRNQKSIKPEVTTAKVVEDLEEMPMIDQDLVLPQMATVLDTLGIPTMKKDRSGRKLNMNKEANGVELKSNGVAFKPKKKGEKVEKVANEDYRKLEQLWETIKELEKLNTNLTDDSLDALDLKNFNLSESLLAQGPNPLESFDISRINDIKKRQQPDATTTTEASTTSGDDAPIKISLGLETTNSTSAGSENPSSEIEIISPNQPPTIIDVSSDADPPSTTASSSSSSSTTTTTESSSSSSESSARFSALEDSFGGGADPVAQEPLPPPRRTGFYFLADWNSFLEVGEDPNKVVISFRPQAGDPSRFLPVNVP